VYNNSPFPIELNIPHLPENKVVFLSNQAINTKTHLPYENVGILYNDVLSQIPNFCSKLNISPSIINWTEDDDIFLPNHLSEAQRGMRVAKNIGRVAYKPYYSYYRDKSGVSLAHNVMEPSIFVDYDYMLSSKFRDTSMDYHFGWIQPLLDRKEMFTDIAGVSTFIYDWSGEIPVFKLSGAGDNSVTNFERYKEHSKDRQTIINPISETKAQEYYSLVK